MTDLATESVRTLAQHLRNCKILTTDPQALRVLNDAIAELQLEISRGDSMDEKQIQELPEMWALVELFGHQRVAGKLTVQNLGAACLLRIDIPECTRTRESFDYTTHQWDRREETTPAHTRFLGVNAIYAINPCSEATVKSLLKNLQPAPVQQYELEKEVMASDRPRN